MILVIQGGLFDETELDSSGVWRGIVGLMTLGTGFSQAQGGGETLFKTRCAAFHGADGKGEVSTRKKLGARDLKLDGSAGSVL